MDRLFFTKHFKFKTNVKTVDFVKIEQKFTRILHTY